MQKGFTLIELLVSVAVFSILMVMALGALLSLSVADRKAETLKSAIDNVTFALDSMSRAIRTGSLYDCGVTANTNPADCNNPTGANYFTFLAAGTVASPGGVQTYYRLETSATDPSGAAASCNQLSSSVGAGCIERSFNGSSWTPITSPDVIIQSSGFLFHALGDPSGDNLQPRVIITISGLVPVSATQTTAFHMQTSVTQRIYDQ